MRTYTKHKYAYIGNYERNNEKHGVMCIKMAFKKNQFQGAQ